MRYFLVLMLGVLSSGCLLELMTTTAIQGKLAAESATQGQAAMNQAKDMKGKTELEQAIKMYTFDQDRYPSSLDDLVPRYLPALPLRGNDQAFSYDPRRGKVSNDVQTKPYGGSGSARMTNQDVTNLTALRQAIYGYWQATRRYPDSLSSLEPLYIQTVPTMSSGGAYLYDPTTGGVNHPEELRVPSSPQQNNSTRQPKMIQENYSDSQLETLVDLGF
jgi:hypothetical protein